MIFRIAGAAVIVGAMGYLIDMRMLAPDRARDAAIREAVLAELYAPSTAAFASIRTTPATFRAEVDAQTLRGVMVRSTFVGEIAQSCDARARRQCWTATVTGSLQR